MPSTWFPRKLASLVRDVFPVQLLPMQLASVGWVSPDLGIHLELRFLWYWADPHPIFPMPSAGVGGWTAI